MIFALNCSLIVAAAVLQAKAERYGIIFRWHDLLGFSIIGTGAVFLPAFLMNLLADTEVQVGLGYLVLGSATSNLLFIGAAILKRDRTSV